MVLNPILLGGVWFIIHRQGRIYVLDIGILFFTLSFGGGGWVYWAKLN